MSEEKDNTIVFPGFMPAVSKKAGEPTDAERAAAVEAGVEQTVVDADAALAAAAEEGRKEQAMDAERQHIRGAQEEQATTSVKINPKAIISWFDKDGKVTTQDVTYRSFPELADFLDKAIELGTPEDTHVEIHLQLVDCFIKPSPQDPDRKPRTKLTIRSGKVGEVIDYLRAKTVEPQAVLLHLQSLIYSLADVSSLKGVIISVVMADARAAGFGFVSESSEVTDQDIQVLAAATTAQADMFKTKMQETRKIAFEGESPIVAASQGELLKLTNGRGVKG